MTKYLAEEVLSYSTYPSIIMRFTYLYGRGIPGGALARIIQETKDENHVIVREEERDYLHVNEAADAISKCLTYRGNQHVFNFGSGHRVAMEKLASRIASSINPSAMVMIEGQKNNLPIDSSLAARELDWCSKRSVLEDVPELL